MGSQRGRVQNGLSPSLRIGTHMRRFHTRILAFLLFWLCFCQWAAARPVNIEDLHLLGDADGGGHSFTNGTFSGVLIGNGLQISNLTASVITDAVGAIPTDTRLDNTAATNNVTLGAFDLGVAQGFEITSGGVGLFEFGSGNIEVGNSSNQVRIVSGGDNHIEVNTFGVLISQNDRTVLHARNDGTYLPAEVRVGALELSATETGDAITLDRPAGLAGSYSLTLPLDDGAAGEYLKSDGAGVLSWDTPAGGGGGGSASLQDRFSLAVDSYDWVVNVPADGPAGQAYGATWGVSNHWAVIRTGSTNQQTITAACNIPIPQTATNLTAMRIDWHTGVDTADGVELTIKNWDAPGNTWTTNLTASTASTVQSVTVTNIPIGV